MWVRISRSACRCTKSNRNWVKLVRKKWSISPSRSVTEIRAFRPSTRWWIIPLMNNCKEEKILLLFAFSFLGSCPSFLYSASCPDSSTVSPSGRPELTGVKADMSVGRSARHSGQEIVLSSVAVAPNLSSREMQSWWKMWRHGVQTMLDKRVRASKQIGHSSILETMWYNCKICYAKCCCRGGGQTVQYLWRQGRSLKRERIRRRESTALWRYGYINSPSMNDNRICVDSESGCRVLDSSSNAVGCRSVAFAQVMDGELYCG